MALNTCFDYDFIIETLKLLRFYSDIGIYDAVVGESNIINDADYYEFELAGLDHVAPISSKHFVGDEYEDENAPDEGEFFHSGCLHTVYYYSSPEMIEYYRLCRLYEHREGIEPDENPYVKAADAHYIAGFQMCDGYFGFGFDSERYTHNLIIELCPENEYNARDIVAFIHSTLKYYAERLSSLERDIRLGKLVWLPELPAHKGGGYR